MKAGELRDLTEGELMEKLESLKKELFKLRFERSISEPADKFKAKKIKKDIARIKTVINEKRRSAEK